MQKNNLNLHICGIHLLNPYKTVVSHLKEWNSLPSNIIDIGKTPLFKEALRVNM